MKIIEYFIYYIFKIFVDLNVRKALLFDIYAVVSIQDVNVTENYLKLIEQKHEKMLF